MSAKTKNPDLHGNAPDESPAALLLIDWINDLEFDGGDALLAHARPAAERVAALARRARAAGVPVIYANDNFGRWRSDFREVVARCGREGVRGQPLAEALRPEPSDYFVLKPKHSAFFATALEVLLAYLGTRRLILTGLTADRCVLFTAADAHMRDFALHVPPDGTASIRADDHAAALAFLHGTLRADAAPTDRLDLAALTRPAPAPG
jgi:nicotinamidase-related amidase